MKRTLRILYIDDDPDTRFLLSELLGETPEPDRGAGVELLQAGDVNDAVERWREATLDGVLVDNRLGGREGVEEIQGLRGVWDCPIWVVTGVPDAGLLKRAVANGAAGLLAKDEVLAGGRRLRDALLRITGAAPTCRSL